MVNSIPIAQFLGFKRQLFAKTLEAGFKSNNLVALHITALEKDKTRTMNKSRLNGILDYINIECDERKMMSLLKKSLVDLLEDASHSLHPHSLRDRFYFQIHQIWQDSDPNEYYFADKYMEGTGPFGEGPICQEFKKFLVESPLEELMFFRRILTGLTKAYEGDVNSIGDELLSWQSFFEFKNGERNFDITENDMTLQEKVMILIKEIGMINELSNIFEGEIKSNRESGIWHSYTCDLLKLANYLKER